jgi:hypothetical protein
MITTMTRGSGGGASSGMFDNFLLYDVMMRVLPYLVGRSLASFLEATQQPKTKCFHFLELQLQRALLVWERARCKSRCGRRRTAEAAALLLLLPPTFDGSIAGTGIVSCLAILDSLAAQVVVQGYLDSNALVWAMPLRHNPLYFHQMLLSDHHQHAMGRTMVPHLPENVAGLARNAAMAKQQGGRKQRRHGLRQQRGGGKQMNCGQWPQASEVAVGNGNNKEDASKGAMTRGRQARVLWATTAMNGR